VTVLIVTEVGANAEAVARAILAETPGFEVIVASAADARGRARQCVPDVALVQLDVTLGLKLVRELLRGRPELKIVAYGLGEDERELSAWVEAGVSRLICRTADLAEIVRSVGSPSSARESTISQRAKHMRASGSALFTPRERDVLQLVAVGLNNREIAENLCLELPTVKNHVQHVMRKLGVHRRAEAARYLRECTNGDHDVGQGPDNLSGRHVEFVAFSSPRRDGRL
jgi:DNA-binding NarL/FixJ family response regulator